MMHIFSMKGKTKRLSIKEIPVAPVLYLPLSQNIGQPAEAIVSVGDRVLKYQMIGKAVGSISANLHSPVSGIVKAIAKYPLADGSLVDSIVIENDFKEEEVNRSIIDFAKLTDEEILNLIKGAGIVGEGGAQFPTHVKYNLKGKTVETFIVNGTECEPYLTADYALMKEKTKELFDGIAIVNKLLKASEIIISIEKPNEDLLSVFRPYLEKAENKNISVAVLPSQYPQGGELQLIKVLKGHEIPRGTLPRNIGIIISNVGTVHAVYKAVVEQKPLVERIVTISGEQATHPGNYCVRIGTPFSHILEVQNKNMHIEDDLLVLGGPMMGKTVVDLSVSLTKGSSGVLFLKKKQIKRENCIVCGYCVDVCPMKLMPLKFAENYRKGKIAKLEKYNLFACIECAACEYVCPSNVPLMQSIKEGKLKLNEILNHAK